MHKLGFYLENTVVQYLRDALAKAKPPTILVHAGDRGLLREIRQQHSPNCFIVGRMFVELGQQTAWLDSADPAGRGRAFAETILGYDFGYARERTPDGRLLVDAWMGLNETLRGPASFASGQMDVETRRRAAALDQFQVAFHGRLKSEGLAAVAFNFAAGNFTRAEHYLEFFPRTLETYTYLGFHEYGWPTLMPRSGTETAALHYRACMEGIRQRYGNHHQVIITELGLARMYKYPNDPAGDVGWLYPGETIPEAQYWESLKWYNAELCKDSYVLGGCLFQVGHAGRWQTFRHLGQDNQQQPILLMDKIATLSCDGNGNGNGNGDKTDLLRRVHAARATLEPAAGLVAALPDRMATLQRDLSELAAAVAAVRPDELLKRAEKAVEQLQQLEEAVGQLDAASGVTAEQRAAWARRIAAAKTQAATLQDAAQKAAELAVQIAAAEKDRAALAPRVASAAKLSPQFVALLKEASSLEEALGGEPVSPMAPPPLHDVRETLPRHATNRYPTRAKDTIRRVLVHHTVTRDDIPPERLAQALVDRGKPGIIYHFLVNGDGTIHWTQPLEAVVDQTLDSSLNAEGVAVALAGSFMEAVPSAEQIASAGRLIAWLLSTLGLMVADVYGRSELDPRVASPGAQWLAGAKYKKALLEAINTP